MTTTLHEVEQGLELVRARLSKHEPRTVVVGAPASGKTSLIERLVRDTGQRFVMVAAPTHDVDAGAVALTQVAVAVDPQFGGLVERLRQPGTWVSKKAHVLDHLRPIASEIVMVLDDPWSGSTTSPTAMPFGKRVTELTEDLFSIPGLRIVLTAPNWKFPLETITLPARSEAKEVLEVDRWGALAAVAYRLRSCDTAALDALSPLDLRLRVALVHAGMKPQEALRRRSLGTAIDNLFDLLGASGRALRSLLARLSVLRLPLQPDDLRQFGADSLDTTSEQLLNRALLYGDEHGLRLHEAIAFEVGRTLTPPQRREAHGLAVQLHRKRFEFARSLGHVATSVRHELETMHHRTAVGDASLLLEDSLWFSDQYVGLGRALSQVERYSEAVTAYERALAHDEDSAYAHHYLAWNLDICALEPARVERHYLRAVESTPDHAWYQSRYVRFLVTRGRTSEARDAWDSALASLYEVHARDDRRVYAEVHQDIVRLLLHRGLLEFAQSVLDDIPTEIADKAAWARAERRLLAALLEARDNMLVFPPRIPLERRVRPLLFDPLELVPGAIWYAGRVDNHDGKACHIRVRRGLDGPLGWLHLSEDELERVLEPPKTAPPAGVFVEVIESADGQRILRRHAAEPYFDDALPPLFPHPDRYIVHRGAPGTSG